MDSYLTIPQYIWEGIFSLMKVLGAGLLLAVFATKYQKRKEIELQVKANVLKLQLETYVRLNAIVCKIRSLVAPPLDREAFFSEIIVSETLGVRYMEYSSFFDTMEHFDGYYDELRELYRTEHIYMQYAVEQWLQEFINYLTEIKQFMDAFCDTEHTDILKLDKKTADEHIRTAYQLVGICVQNDLTRFYCQMDQMLAYEISHISLSYRSHYLKSFRERIFKSVSECLEKYIEHDDYRGKCARWFYFKVLFPSYGNSTFLRKIPEIVGYLCYIHYSDKYTPEQWYDNTNDTEHKKIKMLINDFFSVYKLNLHHG